MADLVGVLATSHAPPLFLKPEYWTRQSAIVDPNNPELISPRTGEVTSYEDLQSEVAAADPGLLDELTDDNFGANFERMQRATAVLRDELRHLEPDTVVVISDDQEELLFDDNMPAFSVYWGDSWTLLPWESPRGKGNPVLDQMKVGWGDKQLEVPVDAELGHHLIGSLIDDDFDVAQFRYLRDEYGGTVGPAGYLLESRSRPSRHLGVPHGFAYVVKVLMDNEPVPMVPVFINTCYPPNRPTPRRCYDFGAALGRAIDSFGAAERVLVIASGGLSHFVLDEELDRLMIKGLEEDDRDLLASLPRLDSPTGEIRNWIAAAGLSQHLQFELVDYVPTPRSAAGTGGGWGFGHWKQR